VRVSLNWSERVLRVALGLLLPVAVMLLFRLSSGLLSSSKETVEGLGEGCDPLWIAGECGDAGVCVNGHCERFVLPSRCGPGEVPMGCRCEPGQEVHLGRCREVVDLKVVPDVCADPSVWEIVRSLQKSCARMSGDEEAPLSSCSAELWGQMSRDSPYLEISLLTLPEAITLHFPEGEPSARSRVSDANAYRAALAPHHVDALRDASAIFIIGRASHGGDAGLNEDLALRRATFAVDLLGELLGDGLPRTVAWGLASDVLVAPASFKAQRRSGSRALAWSPKAEARLVEALHPDTDLQLLDAEEVAWVQDAINRAAFVVPLYCDGTEFNPPAAFQGVGVRGE